MIYFISIIITLSLIMGSLFTAMAPSVNKISRQDFLRKAEANARIEGLQWGDILGRAYPSTNQTRAIATDLITTGGKVKTRLATTVLVKNSTISASTSAE